MKIKITLENGKAVFHGPMTTEALRKRADEQEARERETFDRRNEK